MSKKNENGTCWEIAGLSLPFDLEDADTMERYEKAFEALAAQQAKVEAETRGSARIRAYCMAFRKLFADMFGAEAAEKIFAGVPMRAAAHEEIYDSFLDFCRRQTDAAAAARAERMGKYLPQK